MYHELTLAAKRKRKIKRLVFLAIALVLAATLWLTLSTVHDTLAKQGELSLRNAILNSAKQCASIEGSYPSSVKYLEEHYGLVINHENYSVTYEVFAENVMPSVVVIAR